MRSTLIACFFLLLAVFSPGAEPVAATTAIRALLADFLTNNSDPARHDKFWADELVYTSAQGVVRGKPEIMESVHEATAKTSRSSPPRPTPSAIALPAPTYTAEDIIIRPYTGFAALNFKLVARNPDGTTDTYRNSGTLIYRDHRWQVITWQATPVPPAGTK